MPLHARSGRVAFPRTNVVPARPAFVEAEGADARRAVRRALVRRRVADMVQSVLQKQLMELNGMEMREKEGNADWSQESLSAGLSGGASTAENVIASSVRAQAPPHQYHNKFPSSPSEQIPMACPIYSPICSWSQKNRVSFRELPSVAGRWRCGACESVASLLQPTLCGTIQRLHR